MGKKDLKLRRCFCCGSLSGVHLMKEYKEGKFHVYVLCVDCGVRGPLHKSYEDHEVCIQYVVNQWNKLCLRFKESGEK